MQQDRTFIPGVDENLENLYSRDNYIREGVPSGGTYVPGIQDAPSKSAAKSTKKYEEPVVGFLYSISRKGVGEYWPLHLGTNTIGRSKDNDIYLGEMSVSSHHALIKIRQMKTTGAIIASIQDVGSRTGIFVNDEELDYDMHSCKNGDVLTIGSCYKLLLVIINAKEHGLNVAEDFVEDTVDVEPMQPEGPEETFNPYTRRKRDIEGTIDLSGSNPFDEGNGTQII